jgi:hypothetical protein
MWSSKHNCERISRVHCTTTFTFSLQYKFPHSPVPPPSVQIFSSVLIQNILCVTGRVQHISNAKGKVQNAVLIVKMAITLMIEVKRL